MHRSANKTADVGQQPQRLEQITGNHGQHYVELEVPGGAPKGDGRIVADHLRYYL